MRRAPTRFEAGPARVYRIPLDLFPGLRGYAHLICAPGLTVLIDTGSGLGDSDEQLETGLEAVAREFGETAGWGDLSHVVISHGHIDHFGGLPYVRSKCAAPVGVHRLDKTVLASYERRLGQMAGRLRTFLVSAEVPMEEIETLMEMYLFTKNLYTSQAVDFTIDASESTLGLLRILHVPGHCPGQIVIGVGEIVLTSDHVLPDVTPHMAPASLARHTGLATYLDSLKRLETWHRGSGPALGGHGSPMPDLKARINEIRRHHEQRLADVQQALSEPRTIAELADALFPSAKGYHRLLALEETGAHVEFLSQRGRVSPEPAGRTNGRRLRFRRLEGAPAVTLTEEDRSVDRA
ncbi:MAG TPA: MBL fold metallo-hydrolase [Anaerolineales bacterium]|nr:MBL fold metallo-hydrolase [Anaerolineales bacterium]